MFKTPISILQELAVQQKKSLPDYYIENCNDKVGVDFKCTVTVCSIKAIGYASTKKDAKQNSARKALEILGSRNTDLEVLGCSSNAKQQIAVSNSSRKNVPFINHVGILNELASTHSKPYPVYHEESLPSNGMFVTRCSFLDFVAEGYGLKKKDSKQDAAHSMLEKLKNEDISTITVEMQYVNVGKENLTALTREVLKNYDKLTVTVSNSNITPTSTVFAPIPNVKESVLSLEDVKRELKKYGYKYTLETFQKDPYIKMMKICDTNAVIMGKGEDENQALNDLFQNAVLMFEHGFSLKTDL